MTNEKGIGPTVYISAVDSDRWQQDENFGTENQGEKVVFITGKERNHGSREKRLSICISWNLQIPWLRQTLLLNIVFI
jgi:hypothetical protein